MLNTGPLGYLFVNLNYNFNILQLLQLCFNFFWVQYTVLSVNEYTPFEKLHFKQYLNEHKNIFQNVDQTKFYITSV